MAFYETRFPECISFGSTGGPGFLTFIDVVDSGNEYRNVVWPRGRHRYNAQSGIKTLADYEAVIDHFMVAQGRAHGWRWKDWADYSSAASGSTVSGTDQPLGTGSGIGGTHQLIKRYTFSSTNRDRTITKPVDGTVIIAANGTPLTETTDYTIDYSTGIVTEVTSQSGNTLTAGFEFDVPCRFDTDYLPTTIVSKDGGSVFYVETEIPVIEIRV